MATFHRSTHNSWKARKQCSLKSSASLKYSETSISDSSANVMKLDVMYNFSTCKVGVIKIILILDTLSAGRVYVMYQVGLINAS